MDTGSARQREHWFENFARFGLVSKGIVYCLMGVLTMLTAFGLGGEKASKKEAFKIIYDQPFGKILLVLIIVGLLGYVMLRLFQCFKDIDHQGDHAKGIFTRIGYGVSALIYLALGVYAAQLVIYGPSTGSDERQFIVSKVLEYEAGQWIIALTGLIIAGSGIQQVYKSISGKFMEKVSFYQAQGREIFKKAGVIGYFSRGVVLLIIAYFFIHAAWISNPSEVKGTDAAFDFLENYFGGLLMGLVAFGLVGYGIFMFVKARYQDIHIPLRG